MRRLGAAVAEAVADRIDLVQDFELEARVVRVVVTGAADLQDRAAAALLGQGQDGALALGVGPDVVAARAMTALATDVCVPLTTLGKAAALLESRRVALQTGFILALVFGLQGRECSGVRSL